MKFDKILIQAAIIAIDLNETHTAYLLLIKALGRATKKGQPTGNILRALNALRSHHGRKPFFKWMQERVEA